MEGIWKGAHRLKGSVGSLSAGRAFVAAEQLETSGRAGDMDAARAALSVLEEEVDRLAEALATST